ncbi:MAG TPA: succinate dehydrogenase, cytochrome b556 subunit [Thermomicrobiales bacterium]|nr:succinate dehydrogenase, cytochrome b556 subunit [Thermomicrobiales bacterium]
MLRVYRGREGMISWALHRLTGLGVLLFLFVHIADIFVIGYGPEEFNSLLFIYHALPFRLMEIMLVGALYYHAINGVRIILIDFWDRAALMQRYLFRGVIVVFVVTFIPTALLMLRPLL